jgi:hypothetical protein
MDGAYSIHGDMRNANKILVEEPQGKRQVRRPRRRWKDDTKINLMKIEFGVVDWIHAAQNWQRWWAMVRMIITMGFSTRRV